MEPPLKKQRILKKPEETRLPNFVANTQSQIIPASLHTQAIRRETHFEEISKITWEPSDSDTIWIKFQIGGCALFETTSTTISSVVPSLFTTQHISNFFPVKLRNAIKTKATSPSGDLKLTPVASQVRTNELEERARKHCFISPSVDYSASFHFDGSQDSSHGKLQFNKLHTLTIRIDRSPQHFDLILQYLRTQRFCLDVIQSSSALDAILEEAEFYHITPLVSLLKEHQKTFQEQREAQELGLQRSDIMKILIVSNPSDIKFRGIRIKNLDLSNLDFSKVCLANGFMQGCNFKAALFNETDLSGCKIDGSCFAGVSCTKSDFSQSLISSSDFSGAKLENSSFNNAELSGSNFSSCSWDGACLENVTMEEVNLEKTSLRNSTIKNFTLTKCIISQNSFSCSVFKDVTLASHNLVGCDFTGCKFENVVFDMAIMNSMQFTNAEFVNCSLEQIAGEGIIFQKCEFKGKTNFSNSVLSKSKFTHCKMQKAMLFKCNLQSSQFYKTLLENANLENAILSFSIMELCDLSFANCTQAKLNGASMKNIKLYYTKFFKCDFSDFKAEQPHGIQYTTFDDEEAAKLFQK